MDMQGLPAESEPDRHLRSADHASRARRLAEDARRQALAAQQSAAASLLAAARSMANSADSQDRIAKVIEEAAEHSGGRRTEFREQAARHRKFAQDDRRMAEQLQQIGNEWLDA